MASIRGTDEWTPRTLNDARPPHPRSARTATRSSHSGAEPRTPILSGLVGVGGRLQAPGAAQPGPRRGDRVPRKPQARPRLPPGPVPRIQPRTHLGGSTTGSVPPPPPPRSTVTAPSKPELPGSNGHSAHGDRTPRPGPAPDANCHQEAGPRPRPQHGDSAPTGPV